MALTKNMRACREKPGPRMYGAGQKIFFDAGRQQVVDSREPRRARVGEGLSAWAAYERRPLTQPTTHVR